MISLDDLALQMNRIELLLERLVAPIAVEEGRQLATASDEQRKLHNKGVLARAKAKQANRRVSA